MTKGCSSSQNRITDFCETQNFVMKWVGTGEHLKKKLTDFYTKKSSENVTVNSRKLVRKQSNKELRKHSQLPIMRKSLS